MIRFLTTDDWVGFKKIRLETLDLDPHAWLTTYTEEKDYPDIMFKNKIDYWANYKEFGYLGYFKDGNLVAYILMSPNYWPAKKHIINLSDFVVTSGERRKGVGKELIKNIIELAKNIQEAERLQLFVNSDNIYAIKFYENFGFKRVATISKGVKDAGGNYQDEYIYTYEI